MIWNGNAFFFHEEQLILMEASRAHIYRLDVVESIEYIFQLCKKYVHFFAFKPGVSYTIQQNICFEKHCFHYT